MCKLTGTKSLLKDLALTTITVLRMGIISEREEKMGFSGYCFHPPYYDTCKLYANSCPAFNAKKVEHFVRAVKLDYYGVRNSINLMHSHCRLYV